MDDGTICRLDDDSFYVTTTSSGAGRRLPVVLVVARRLAARRPPDRRHAGALGRQPRRARARGRSWASSPSSTARPRRSPTSTASGPTWPGVPCLLLRIGFVGEVGYEMHFPSVARRAPLGRAARGRRRRTACSPFGLEPQRLLRLQKMHILVGQDTDSESTPFGAAMPWIVKLDKDQDFIGKWALERAAADDLETTLVGFTLPNGHVPTEGAVVLPDGDGPVGQVTSARFSPQLGGVIGMAWVPASLAKDGAHGHDLRRGQAARGRGRDQALLRPRRRGAPLVSLEFLTPAAVGARAQPDGAPGAGRGRAARAARRLERGRGLRRRAPRARAAARPSVGFADRSHLGKIELQAARRDLAAITGALELGRATRARRRLVVPVHRRRRRSCSASPRGTAALRERLEETARPSWTSPPRSRRSRSSGPLAPEMFARFTALDLRPRRHARATASGPARWRARPARSCARPSSAG